MTNPLTTKGAQNFSLLLARLALGALFIVAGWSKVSSGVSGFVNANARNVPAFLPDYIGRTYLFLVPFVELLVGLALALGIFARVAALIMLLMLVSFTVAVTGVLSQKPFHPNVVYMTLAFLLVAHGPGAYTASHLFKGGGGGAKKSAD
jgi:uncharacterized membrane protein YphA (DoxX/SURF4 family)